MLDPGDHHRLWYEQAGAGIDALVLHGGPGSGCHSAHYDLFDLTRYRVTLLDQRGAGRSHPHAGDDLRALDANTTAHLISDIERLRVHLGIERWVVFGGSWGTTLGMIYAQAFPARVRALVLAGVATTTFRDLKWLYGDIGNIFPEAYAAFSAHVPHVSDAPDAVLERIGAYATLLRHDKTAQAAADAWCQWEVAIFGGDIRAPGSRFSDARFRLGFARVVTHYFSQSAWLTRDQIQRNVARIAHIPCHMIHSRFDPSCPLRAAWDLSRDWPAAQLTILPGTTHSALDGDMRSAIRAATDRLWSEM